MYIRCLPCNERLFLSLRLLKQILVRHIITRLGDLVDTVGHAVQTTADDGKANEDAAEGSSSDKLVSGLLQVRGMIGTCKNK